MEWSPVEAANLSSSTTPSLAPSVLESISGRRYSCSVGGTGIQFCDVTNDNTQYETDIRQYLPLRTPKLTKAGKVAVHQPHVPKKSLRWWKAQCGFRGLPVSGTLLDLQERVREHGARGLNDRMKQARDNMSKTYVMNNKRALEDAWVRQDDNEKAKLWPQRLLYEVLTSDSEPGTKTLAVEVDGWGENMERIASQLHIHCEMRKLPDHKTGQRLVILGLDAITVRSKIADLDRDIRRTILRKEQDQERRRQDAQQAFETKFHAASAKRQPMHGLWDISGYWEVSCPDMEEEWGSEEAQCSIGIGLTGPTETGLKEIYATFDFISITGIMRFVNLNAVIDAAEKGDEPRSEEESEEAPSDAESEISSECGPSPAHFLFPNAMLPSQISRQFMFRWRGEETGEGEIQLDSDEKLCSIIFESPNALSGTFKSGLAGDVKFRGVRRTSRTEKQMTLRRLEDADGLDPDAAWRARDKSAYERARVGRWGKWTW